MKISTSMLSSEKSKINELNNSITDYFHVDIMDGVFVSNNTVNKMDELLELNKKPLDFHLMVSNVSYYLNKYLKYNPKYITFHIETDTNINDCINLIHKYGIKAGIAINPDTSIDKLLPYLADIDLVLVMSVNPGLGGQKFIKESTINKINKLLNLRQINNYNYEIEVDGGINIDTVSDVKECDIIVSGSYITNGNFSKNINNLINKIR